MVFFDGILMFYEGYNKNEVKFYQVAQGIFLPSTGLEFKAKDFFTGINELTYTFSGDFRGNREVTGEVRKYATNSLFITPPTQGYKIQKC